MQDDFYSIQIDISENHDDWPTRGVFTPKQMGAIVFAEELVAL